MDNTSSKSSISFFIPVYNEDANVENVLNKLSLIISLKNLDAEIIIIDDYSTDESLAIIKKFVSRNVDLNIRVVSNAFNEGLGANFFKAVSLAGKEYFRLVNGDDVETIETHLDIISLLGQTNLIVPFYRQVLGRNLFREYLSKLYTFILNLITGYNLNYYNGAPVYELRKLKKVIKFNSSMSYSAETLVRYMGQATTIIQVGVNGVHRAGSKSITLKNLIGAIKLFLRLINLRILNNL